MTVSPLELLAVFAFGLMVGSFLNVCIWRLPEEEQVVRGRSHCRKCGKQIAGYDNIPLVSYLVLGGKCRHCKAPISWSYPAVELASGILFAGMLLRFGWSWAALVYAALGAALIVLTVIDWRIMELPDEITLPGIGVGLVASFLVPQLHGQIERWPALWAGLLGVIAGGGSTWFIKKVGSWLFKQEAMGDGDIKLMAMVGGFIGVWKVLAVNFFFGPLLGSVLGIAVVLKKGYRNARGTPIPYGPFLALGTWVAILCGDAILGWYKGLLFFGAN